MARKATPPTLPHVGQVFEDFKPIYGLDSVKRKMRVLEIHEDFVVFQVFRDAKGAVCSYTSKVKRNRLRPVSDGYVPAEVAA